MRVLSTAICVALLGMLPLAVFADEPTDPPLVATADLKGRTGAFRIIAVEHDTRTAHLTDVARRVGLKPADATGADYVLAQTPFYVYVPKAPADTGKFGIMVGLAPTGRPPEAWSDVLERRHLIWIAPASSTDNSNDTPTAVRRVALLLDAVHAVRKSWNVDTERVYLSANIGSGPAAGTPFYYPEVFAGVIQTPRASWFTKLKGFGKPPATVDTDTVPRPQSSDLARSKTHTRFYLVAADKAEIPEDPAGKTDPLAGNADLRLIVRHGFQSMGFKFVQASIVPHGSLDDYAKFSADWLDQGIAFLDAPLDAQRQRTAAGASLNRANTPPNGSGSPVGPVRVPGGASVPTPGGFGIGGLGF